MAEAENLKVENLRLKAQRYHRLADALATPGDALALHELALRCEQRAEEDEGRAAAPSRH